MTKPAAACLILAASLLLGCNPRELALFKKASEISENEITRQTEEAIKNDPALQEMDAVCKKIPLPEDFRFLWKARLDERRLILITHYFSNVGYDEVRETWINYFVQNGWKLEKQTDGRITKRLEFGHSDERVVIEHQPGNKTMNYAIYCERLDH